MFVHVFKKKIRLVVSKKRKKKKKYGEKKKVNFKINFLDLVFSLMPCLTPLFEDKV